MRASDVQRILKIAPPERDEHGQDHATDQWRAEGEPEPVRLRHRETANGREAAQDQEPPLARVLAALRERPSRPGHGDPGKEDPDDHEDPAGEHEPAGVRVPRRSRGGRPRRTEARLLAETWLRWLGEW